MRQLARWISIVGHPFAMIALLIAVPAAQRSPGDAFQSVMLVVIVVFVPIALLMFRQVRRGLWSNVDASNRSERPILFVIALAGVAAAVAWLRLYNPQSFLVQGMLVIAAFLLVARQGRRDRLQSVRDPEVFTCRLQGTLHGSDRTVVQTERFFHMVPG